jgi:twitching motility protein PilI
MTANGINTAFAKLREYERRSKSFSPGSGKGAGPSDEWSGVIFRMGDTRMACDIDRILEILPFPQYTTVPGAKPWILGLANIRGTLLTVVDLAWFLTGVRSPVTARTRLLSATLQQAPVGLMIDEVFGQRHFLDSDSKQAELEKDSSLRKIVSRQHQTGTETWHTLDLDRLFHSQDFLNGAAN